MQQASVILPAYNEEKNIGNVISSIKETGDYEIIVVDDGSSDRTAAVARKHGCVCISLGKNRGKAYACLMGARIASHENIVFIDSDNQHDPGEIPSLVKELEENDMVIGKRDFSTIPIHRRVTNELATKSVSIASKTKFSDVLCGFRAIKRSKFFLLGLKNNRYEFESEMIMKASENKLKIKEVPIKARYGVGSSMPIMESAKIAMFILTQMVRR